jgi:2-keto-4-pentenoate hydratase/2-oxohepta-3-ene-1,7-dioic acid hydratase in catechol pathway
LRFCRFQNYQNISYGLIDGDYVFAISPDPFDKWEKTGREFRLDKVKLLAPCVPSKVVAVGLNYVDHAGELNMDVPKEPVIFLKPTEAVIGPGDEIVYPDTSEQVDYEAEISVVIKKRASRVTEDDAGEYILGYTCANDVTARDLQRKDGQWTRAKGFDTFAPIGPWVETDFDPSDVTVQSILNGEIKQSSSTKNMIFGIPKLVSFITNVMTLNPGDVIMTGTPPGVGSMDRGDEIEVVVEGLASLKNKVV